MRGRPRACTSARSVRTSRLADSWLAADQHHLAATLVAGLLPGATQQPDFFIAADQPHVGGCEPIPSSSFSSSRSPVTAQAWSGPACP